MLAKGVVPDGPECPEPLRYLKHWAYELHGKSGVDMNGLTPLTFNTVDAWSRLMQTEPEPMEVEALFVLDHVLRRPEDFAKKPEPKTDAWPTKKAE